ncbi:ABC transporter ATP-binding protein [Sutterella faecalis]|uniref:ABC transporter ATP-binding protein n=3 Tax=Sutterella TaxID=40544 RepID=A0ABX5VCB5_9BURK|nr:ATP-binding cassette domain-containing protein [Sutterella faecalis]QDA53848.1 ABC transporter ATP-binding protein [Sutterella faecalis]
MPDAHCFPVEVKNLRKTFRGPDGKPFAAIDNLSVLIPEPGAIVSLIGPDGAGKTTLLRLLAGILTPEDGEIRLFGRRPDTDDPDFVAMLGFMPQRFGLYEELSVWENFRIFGALRGIRGRALEARFRDLMTLSGLRGFESREAGKLSGGMKQKLGLSCSLLAEPKILLLDEPTVGVDPLSRRELWRILRDMRDRTGMTVLVSTAYLDEAEAADRTILISSGRLIAEGDPRELARETEGRTWLARAGDERRTLALARTLMREVRAANPRAPWLDAVPHGNAVNLLSPEDARSGASEESFRTLPEGTKLSSRTPALEDAYCALTFPRADRTDSLRILPPAYAVQEPEAVVARSISRRFGSFTAVEDTSFSVKKGEIFGLLGPNGAGKTTTFRMLCGLLPPSGGTISVAGSDLRTARSAARAKVGYVAQKFSLYAQLSARQNLEYFGACFGVAGQTLDNRIHELTTGSDLGERLQSITRELPLGAKRELALACALIHRPAILFLDEATSGADIAARRAFWRRIVGLAETGTTVIVTTHFLEEAEYCDRFLIQDAGRVLTLGTPSEVRHETGAASIEEAFISIVTQARRERANEETPS